MKSLADKERCILDLLVARRELYGLELVEASGGELKRGTVYVTLSRMEQKGLVEGRTETAAEPHPGLPRRLFRATPLGVQALKAQRAFDRVLVRQQVRS
jgi:PadR family transcriptional regulator PadR